MTIMAAHPTAARCTCAKTAASGAIVMKAPATVEAEEHSQQRGGENVGECQRDMQLHAARRDCARQASPRAHRDMEERACDEHRRPRHPVIRVDPEMRHHPHRARDERREGDPVGSPDRHFQPQREWGNDVEGAEDGAADPRQRERVHERDHSRVVERPAGKRGIKGEGQQRHRQPEMGECVISEGNAR